jgi:hypothetical protein
VAERLAVVDRALDELGGIDTTCEFDAGHEPTVGKVVQHVRHAINERDSAIPVILSPENRVIDGAHRIVRALLDDPTHITAVRLEPLPPRDLRHVALGSTGIAKATAR